MLLETLAASSIWLASTSSWCQAPATPRVETRIAISAPRLSNAKSSAELRNFDIDTVNPYGAHVHTSIGGLTSGVINVGHETRLAGARRGSSSCLWVDHIQITIRLDPVVYVAREYAPNSCEHKAIFAHEMKHVRVDQQIVNQFSGRLRDAVAQAVRTQPALGPVARGQDPTLQQKFVSRISAALSAETKRMEAERNRRQQAIDTIAEYEYVARQCK